MTTQITTHEQAELHLHRNHAVITHHGQEMVEGKKLLEICGFNYARPNDGIREQISRHSLSQGQDFMREEDLTHTGRGQRPVLYHFTLNAANHILLAAMTPEGHDARQEAIDMRNETNSTSSDPITILLQSMLDTRLRAEAQEQRITHQEERVSQVEQAVSSIETRMDNQGCDEGFMPRTEAFRHYGRGLSKSMFYLVISHEYFEIGSRPLTITTESFVNNTVQVNEEDVHAAITLFYEGLVQVTPTRYTHHLFGNRRFQA